MNVFMVGGAGFIGSNLLARWRSGSFPLLPAFMRSPSLPLGTALDDPASFVADAPGFGEDYRNPGNAAETTKAAGIPSATGDTAGTADTASTADARKKAAREGSDPLEITVCDTLNGGVKWKNFRAHVPDRIIPPAELDNFLRQHGKDLDVVMCWAATENIYGALPHRSWDNDHRQRLMDDQKHGVDHHLAAHYHLHRHLWQWCTHHEKVFIFGSTSHTYGDGTQGFDDPSEIAQLHRLRPLNAWSWSQHLFDLHALRESQKGQCPPRWYGLKMFDVYGPNEHHKGQGRSLITFYAGLLRQGNPIPLARSYRDDIRTGDQQRDFVWIEDALQVVDHLVSQCPASGLVNVGTGQATRLRDIISMLGDSFGVQPQVEELAIGDDTRTGQSYFEQARLEGLRQRDYHTPFTTPAEGIALLVSDYFLGKSMFR